MLTLMLNALARVWVIAKLFDVRSASSNLWRELFIGISRGIQLVVMIWILILIVKWLCTLRVHVILAKRRQVSSSLGLSSTSGSQLGYLFFANIVIIIDTSSITSKVQWTFSTRWSVQFYGWSIIFTDPTIVSSLGWPSVVLTTNIWHISSAATMLVRTPSSS